jgi:putative cell wall-binding protein
VFTADGNLITWFGASGTGDGQFLAIQGICLDGSRGAYVPDTGNDRVQKWSWEQPTEVSAVSGSNRFSTAIKASQEGWPNGLDNNECGLKTAIVATGLNWPDALGGAGLAGAIDAPILLVETDELPSAVASELTRLGAQQVYILGGTSAVSAGVAQDILALPAVTTVERFGGSNRYATALLIASEVTNRPSYEGSAFIATGEDFPDALAAAPVAAYNAYPIYLTPSDSLSANVKNQLAADTSSDSFVLGGTSAVSGEVMDQVEAALPGLDVDRIWGADRYATALAVTSAFGYEGATWHLNWNHVALATGRDFPDALAGGPVQGRSRSFMLLTSGETLESPVADAIAAHKDEIYEIRYLGGTVVIEPDVRSSAEALLW